MFRQVLTAFLFLTVFLHSSVSAQDIEVGDSRLSLQILGRGKVSREQVQQWVERDARAVSLYFGRFPVDQLKLVIQFRPGDSLGGRAYGSPEPSIELWIGEEVDHEQMLGHWILTHELVHLGFPNANGERWVEEGMATYLEPIVRIRAGLLDEMEFWGDFLWGMPHGLPGRGHRGLRYDQTWGRVYWGGALFWFLTDLEIREQTKNRKSVDDVFRAILSQGGNIESDWSLEELARVGDAATGTTVLRDAFSQYADNPGGADLTQLWQELGIKDTGASLEFGPAPRSWLRESLTESMP